VFAELLQTTKCLPKDYSTYNTEICKPFITFSAIYITHQLGCVGIYQSFLFFTIVDRTFVVERVSSIRINKQ